jgi:hypothetical protein
MGAADVGADLLLDGAFESELREELVPNEHFSFS